jgi:hypothetical protein
MMEMVKTQAMFVYTNLNNEEARRYIAILENEEMKMNQCTY